MSPARLYFLTSPQVLSVAVIIYAMAITAVMSSYAIRFSHPLYGMWERMLTKLGRPAASEESAKPQAAEDRSMEALRPAVFLDRGFDAARAVIDRLFAPLIDEVDPARPAKDPKTALQEWLQARRAALPVYTMVNVAGEAHAQEFEVACEVEKFGIRTLGRGTSRRAAEQQSAELALAALRKK